jgi:FRG domain
LVERIACAHAGHIASAVLGPLRTEPAIVSSPRNTPIHIPGRAGTLEKLGPPRAGHSRVFRGQTGNYGRMVPSGLRVPRLPREYIFHAYSHTVAWDLKGAGSSIYAVDITEMLLWVRAMAQHYGPGSEFLDVTHSLDVALWFALQKVYRNDATHLFGRPGPYDPDNDTLAVVSWLQYLPSDDKGYLYVFDVPEPEDTPPLAPGVLVDLSKAPEVFASSPRLQAQQACLIRADPSVTGGDLGHLYACEPIPVCWPMTGSDMTRAPASAMFPGPKTDPWYRRFVSIPWIDQLDPGAKALRVSPPLPLSMILPEPGEKHDIGRRLIVVQPLHAFAEACTIPEFSGALPEPWQAFRLADATPIMLEAPLMGSTPPVDGGAWNEALLVSDLPDSVEAVEAATGTSIGEVGLLNVLLELSPLEKAGWERVEQEGGELSLLRGIWLVRSSENIGMAFFWQDLPKPATFTGFGFVTVRLDRISQKLRVAVAESDNSQDITEFPPYDKRLFTALLLLRELSPSVKAAPFPTLSFEGGIDELRTHVVDVRGKAAVLARVWDPSSGSHWYSARSLDIDEPFSRPEVLTGHIELHTDRTFSEVPVDEVRDQVINLIASN